MTGKRLCVPVLTYLLLQSVTFAATRSPELVDQLQAQVPDYLRQYSVPGAAVALIREGRVVWMWGFGHADVATGRAVTPDTLFNAGSISKSVTAWGVLRLVDRRLMTLDAPVDTWLRRWHVPPGDFDATLVTPRRLLSHTAGISNHGYGGSDPKLPMPPVEDSLNGKSGTGVVSLVSQPGSSFEYSGANYLILQLAIEDLTGQAFRQFMAAEIFKPLGMKDSRFDLPDSTAAATPYDAFERPLPPLRYHELAAAGLFTSLQDLATFAAAALPERKRRAPAGRGVVRTETLAMAMRPVANTRWTARDPFGPGPEYGLGYTVRPEQFAGNVGIGHGGSNNGWESLFQIIPATGDGIVIMTNSSNGSAVIASVLCLWRRNAAHDAPCPTVDARIPLLAAYRAQGVDAATRLHAELLARHATEYDLGSRQLNSLGYQVLRSGDLPGAIQLFELNARTFPNEWNVHDSLGEAYAAAKRREEAIRSYRRSLELNPYSESGKQALQELGASP